MQKLRIIALAAALGAVATGCAPATGASGTSAPARGTNVITQAEIDALTGVRTARQAIETLRPNWLRARGSTSITRAAAGSEEGIVVYLDRNRLGGIASLEQLNVLDFSELRFLTAAEATQRFGTGHPLGAIVLTAKTR